MAKSAQIATQLELYCFICLECISSIRSQLYFKLSKQFDSSRYISCLVLVWVRIYFLFNRNNFYLNYVFISAWILVIKSVKLVYIRVYNIIFGSAIYILSAQGHCIGNNELWPNFQGDVLEQSLIPIQTPNTHTYTCDNPVRPNVFRSIIYKSQCVHQSCITYVQITAPRRFIAKNI